MLPPLKPIPIKERLSIVFVEKGEIDVVDGAFVVVDQQGFRVLLTAVHSRTNPASTPLEARRHRRVVCRDQSVGGRW